MKNIFIGLILILITSGFIVAEPISDIRTDFYVSTLSTNSSEQNFFSNTISQKSLTPYCIALLIALAIIIVILQKILKHKEKEKTKKFQKIKKARRKK